MEHGCFKCSLQQHHCNTRQHLENPSLHYIYDLITSTRMSSRTPACDPFRNKDCIGSHGSLSQSPHRTHGILLSQHSAGHTLGELALHTRAKNTTSRLTMQRDGIFLRVRIQNSVKPVLRCILAGFTRMFAANRTDIVRNIGHIIPIQHC